MATVKQLQAELSKLQQRRMQLISEREQVRRDIEQIRHDAAQRVLDGKDIGDLVEPRNKLEMLIEANIGAVDVLYSSINRASVLLDAEQIRQAQLESERQAKLEREMALYR
jgi:glucose-6-phosphate-specific signal transduction histidine kinase